jgi:iron complex transport system substrate-binding protein
VILAALGELDRVVACTKYCADVVPEITTQPRTILADSWTANAEQIIAVQPDLVIASVPYQEKAIIEILKSGTSFLGFAPKSLAAEHEALRRRPLPASPRKVGAFQVICAGKKRITY